MIASAFTKAPKPDLCTLRALAAIAVGVLAVWLASSLTPLSWVPAGLGTASYNAVAQLLFQLILGGLGLVGLVLVGRDPGPKGAFDRAALTAASRVLILYVAFTALWLWATSCLTGAAVQEHKAVIQNASDLAAVDAWGLPLTALSTIVAAPVVEEWVFRGVLFAGLRRLLALWPAALLCASVFVYAHDATTPWPLLVPIGALALGLCWLREHSGSLAPCVLVHALVNTVAFLGWAGGLTTTNLVVVAGCWLALALMAGAWYAVRRLGRATIALAPSGGQPRSAMA